MEEYLKDISDGKLYSSNDMVKVGCHDCTGCSACCCDMGESILLDPMDVWRLERNLGQSFEQLLAGAIDLHVEDGLILPNLKMAPSATGPKCSFLNEEGRCSIHGFRPGICRLFPLGRNYEGEKLSYFLLTDAKLKTLPVGLMNLMAAQKSAVQYGQMYAGLVIVMLPVLILYMCVQKTLTQGMTLGGLKG